MDLDGSAKDIETPSPHPEYKEEDVFVGVYAGRSQRGYVPYNPHKINQDWMLIREDPVTCSLILGTFDGHGEHGHCIAEVSASFVMNCSLSVYSFIIILYTTPCLQLTSKGQRLMRLPLLNRNVSIVFLLCLVYL